MNRPGFHLATSRLGLHEAADAVAAHLGHRAVGVHEGHHQIRIGPTVEPDDEPVGSHASTTIAPPSGALDPGSAVTEHDGIVGEVDEEVVT